MNKYQDRIDSFKEQLDFMIDSYTANHPPGDMASMQEFIINLNNQLSAIIPNLTLDIPEPDKSRLAAELKKLGMQQINAYMRNSI